MRADRNTFRILTHGADQIMFNRALYCQRFCHLSQSVHAQLFRQWVVRHQVNVRLHLPHNLFHTIIFRLLAVRVTQKWGVWSPFPWPQHAAHVPRWKITHHFLLSIEGRISGRSPTDARLSEGSAVGRIRLLPCRDLTALPRSWHHVIHVAALRRHRPPVMPLTGWHLQAPCMSRWFDVLVATSRRAGAIVTAGSMHYDGRLVNTMPLLP